MALVLPQDQRSPYFRRGRWSRVKNSSGVVIPPFSVVLISNVSCDSTTGYEIVYSVIQPNAASTDFNRDLYLVTGPIAIGVSDTTNEGYATDLSEPGFVRYGSGSPTIGQVWGAKHGQFTLAQYYYGFEILGGTTTAASNSIVVARWIGVHMALGKTDSSINKSASGTVSVWAGASGSESDTTMNITSVYNRFANVGSGKWVMVGVNADQPYLISAEC